MSNEQIAEPGWYEFHTKNALTSVAYVHENGDIFIPDPEFSIEHGTCFHRLVREPRTVTTVEELLALPAMTVVRSAAGSIVNIVGGEAYFFGYETTAPATTLALPATVLHEGAA